MRNDVVPSAETAEPDGWVRPASTADVGEGTAVFVFSTSTVVLRSRVLPLWLAYLGYGIAVAMFVVPFIFEPMGVVFPCWVLLVSVVVLQHSFSVSQYFAQIYTNNEKFSESPMPKFELKMIVIVILTFNYLRNLKLATN